MQTEQPQEKYTRDGTKRQHRQVRFSFNIEEDIPQDAPVRLANAQLEELNYKKLYGAESATGRKSAVDVGVMFKVLVYAYMNGCYSSRKIEQACRMRLDFRWLLDKERIPDHSTISRFRTNPKYQAAFIDLFFQYVKLLEANGDTEHDEVFIDGTKLESRANRYTYVWRKNLERALAKTRERAAATMRAAGAQENATLAELEALLRKTQQRMKDAGITPVSGQGKRKPPLQKNAEALEALAEQWRRYEQQLTIMGARRSSYAKTDHAATFMRMKDDHLGNGQLKPGYNVQIAVNSGYVTGFDVYSDRNDVRALIPFLDMLFARHGKRYARVCADSGYESYENYVYLMENAQESHIKPKNHDIRKTKKFAAQIGRMENMVYDKLLDHFLCKLGRRLTLAARRQETQKDGKTREMSYYTCEDCRECPHRAACCRAKDLGTPKTIQVCWELERLRNESQANISTELGTLLRVNRAIQCEGAFGHLKHDRNFTRFLTCGAGVRAELCFLFLSQNILKYISGQKNLRQKTHLIRPKARQKS